MTEVVVRRPHRQPSRGWKLLILAFGILVCLPVLLAFDDTINIPQRGDYGEICAAGHKTKGTIESVREDGDADDDHWLVINFVYSHGGRDYVGTASSNNWAWKAGDEVTVRYLGSQAVLPEIEPVDVDPTNDFWLVLLFSFSVLVATGVGIGTIAGLYFVIKSVGFWRDGDRFLYRK